MLLDDRRVFRRRVFLTTLLALVVVFVLWNVPGFDFITYPLRLFVTYVHEAGHSLAAVISGGQVLGFEVFENGGGVAYTSGGARWLILPAGYLGAALFGAILFYLANRLRYVEFLSACMAVLLLFFPLLLNSQSLTAMMVGLGFGLLFLLMTIRASRDLNRLVLAVLAAMTGLNAVMDLLFLTRNPEIGAGATINDAAKFAQEVAPALSPWMVAVGWAAIAVLLLLISFYYSVVRPLRRGL
ncbi:MAG: M50 family peptidase [Chloroflexi bacterium]|nr:MAG: M50 family peptidase [Chloroflexota bacterium]